MSLHRRPIGRPRLLAVVASLVMLVGCLLPWWSSGGADAIPMIGGNAFSGSGILVFVAAIAVLALVTLPYAAGDAPLAVDSWLSYLMVAMVGWLGLVVRLIDLAAQGAFVFRDPFEAITRGPGLILVVVGLLILAEAVFELFRARHERFG